MTLASSFSAGIGLLPNNCQVKILGSLNASNLVYNNTPETLTQTTPFSGLREQ
jgi:hypothetical protein